MGNIYETGEYLEATGQTWHSEDSPWKAGQISTIIERNSLHPGVVAEIGCGAGQVLVELSRREALKGARFHGYDISPQAIELCRRSSSDNCTFHCDDLLRSPGHSDSSFDILLAIDVFEHVPDYLNFLEQCRRKATYKIYHIPLDIHVSSVLRNSFLRNRYSIGHLHYFTADSALATLRDTGHEIVDFFYTNGSSGVFQQHRSVKTALANVPRWLLSRFSLSLAARILGGYSLLVLAK